MGAGILPVALHNHTYYFLFSKEYQTKGNKIDWRDFGGTSEKNETIKETAIREAWEESDGFLGNKQNIKRLINNHICTIKTQTYFIYVVPIKYDKTLPQRFKKKFDMVKAKYPEKIAKKGFYEKEKLKWIKLEHLLKHMDKFQPWYKKIVIKLHKTFMNKKFLDKK